MLAVEMARRRALGGEVCAEDYGYGDGGGAARGAVGR